LPLATGDIFRRVAKLEAVAMQAGSSSQYQLRTSFVEVYRERVFDLLSPTKSRDKAERQQLRLREQDDGSVTAEGVAEIPVRSIAEMLACVARGSATRATAATGVHEHSSRSHAVLTLTLEHRWRSERDDGIINKQHAKLTLVDLAGSEDMTRSHGGAGNDEGIATNLGLHALTRVLAALASDAEHIPYRDAMLTRLLQPALGGDCVTQMLACISPAAQDAAETERTLRWAATARGLVSQARVHISEEEDADPMLGDHEDPSPLQRRALWLGPLPGCSAFLPADEPVFARVAGDPASPLVLYVHGSGPRNSSMFWNNLVEAVYAFHPKFYHVAICCPGYGRSPGDRQTIRSYPGALIEGVIRACGKRTAVALVGSSQGACAVMNALLERPGLAESVAVCHPVGHAVERYSAIKVPALLIFDTEDDGHPVEVGRRMREALPNPTYFEFTYSKDGPWEEQNMASELVKILLGCPSIKGKKRRQKPLPELSTLAGGMRAWTEQHGDEHGWTWDIQEEATETPNIPLPGNKLLPAEAADELFSDEESEDEEAAAAAAAAAAAKQLAKELQQTDCRLCGQGLGSEPVRLQRCRHALCAECCRWALLHFNECPVCEAPVERARRKKIKKKSAVARGLAPLVSDVASIGAQAPRATAGAAPPAQVLVLGYGNTISEKTKGKADYSTFVKVADGDIDAIERVAFNINPGYDKPTVVLQAPNSNGGVWSFDYAMARSYPCHITVHFRQQTGLPSLKIEYYVQETSKFMRRIAIELPAGQVNKSRRRGGHGLVLDEDDCTSSGWFVVDGKGSWRWCSAC
jgi:predicted esterase